MVEFLTIIFDSVFSRRGRKKSKCLDITDDDVVEVGVDDDDDDDAVVVDGVTAADGGDGPPNSRFFMKSVSTGSPLLRFRENMALERCTAWAIGVVVWRSPKTAE